MRIYIIAPGFSSLQSDLDESIQLLKKRGFEVIVPKGLFQKDILSASPKKQRIKHLKLALQSEAHIIWCLRGGYGSIELLDELKKLKKPKKKKILWGYSDITALHSFFVNQWDWPVIHGPVLESISQKNRITQKSQNLLWKTLEGDVKEFTSNALTIVRNENLKSQKIIKSKLVGGNLTTLCSLIGTPFSWNLKNKILFIEDLGERAYKIDRMLNQLKLSGHLKGLKALIFGEFLYTKDPDGRDKFPQVIKKWAKDLNCPVLKGFKVGHGVNQPPLFLNTKATLEIGKKCFLKVTHEDL